MSAFFRFPHTPHLTWLGAGTPRDDKVLSRSEAEALLRSDVVVEEKLDGANLGISLGADGTLRLQNRGQYLVPPYAGQFQRLRAWLAQHQADLCEALTPEFILFGEWCAARHSVCYERLPDWFIAFDVYNRAEGQFLSTAGRNAFALRAGLSVVPELFRGHATLESLHQRLLTESSRYRAGPIEGLVIRGESEQWLTARAKLVHPQFVQNIGEHWRSRKIEWNALQGGASTGRAGPITL